MISASAALSTCNGVLVERQEKGDAKRARAPLPLSELYLFPSRHLS